MYFTYATTIIVRKRQRNIPPFAETSILAEKQQHLKSKKTEAILAFAKENSLLYQEVISESNFIGEGAEQKVYRLNESQIIKTNAGIFYEYRLIT